MLCEIAEDYIKKLRYYIENNLIYKNKPDSKKTYAKRQAGGLE